MVTWSVRACEQNRERTTSSSFLHRGENGFQLLIFLHSFNLNFDLSSLSCSFHSTLWRAAALFQKWKSVWFSSHTGSSGGNGSVIPLTEQERGRCRGLTRRDRRRTQGPARLKIMISGRGRRGPKVRLTPPTSESTDLCPEILWTKITDKSISLLFKCEFLENLQMLQRFLDCRCSSSSVFHVFTDPQGSLIQQELTSSSSSPTDEQTPIRQRKGRGDERRQKRGKEPERGGQKVKLNAVTCPGTKQERVSRESQIVRKTNNERGKKTQGRGHV